MEEELDISLTVLINEQLRIIKELQIEALGNILENPPSDQIESITVSTSALLNLLSAAKILNIT